MLRALVRKCGGSFADGSDISSLAALSCGAIAVRLPDATVQGVPVYVVEATPKPSAESDYSKFVIHVETAHYVPLEVHYWDTAGVQVKRLWAERGSIQQFGKVFMPLRATMRHVLRETQTRLRIDRVVPDPELGKSVFDVRRLETH